MALKIIFGFGNTYNQLLEKTGLRTLKDRREEACLKFAIKLKDSECFSYLFPENPTFNLRVTKKYKEDFARTERMYMSPLYAMRRMLNEHY